MFGKLDHVVEKLQHWVKTVYWIIDRAGLRYHAIQSGEKIQATTKKSLHRWGHLKIQRAISVEANMLAQFCSLISVYGVQLKIDWKVLLK